MLSLKTALLTLAGAAIVSADYVIDPNSVSKSTRTAWCSSELSTCPIICQQIPPGTTLTNTCDPDSLTYGCVCGNGLQPNVSEYTLTLPYFVCTEWGNQCVKDCGDDGSCASSCRQDHPCGALSPQRENKTTSTASSTPSATNSNQVFTNGLDGGSSPTSKPKDNAGSGLFELGNGYGFLVMGASFFAGFAMML
ncbi:hypothetical protein VTK73DRAFT_7157 [Phialemonium thermophilum]|uniref:DUF7707 domain-containing protein n=1 Tax=Phialemonium thermophilum TaxID=223376 RepID=A0ABR3XUE6_9PEZI